MASRQGKKLRGVYEHPAGSGVWWIQYFEHGRRHREKIGPRALAIAVREKRRTEIREGRYFPNLRRRTVLLDDLVAEYRAWAKREGRAIIKGDQCYSRLLGEFGGKRADNISLADIEAFKHKLAERLSVATVNRNLALLRAIFNRALVHDRIERSPMKGVKFERENNMRRRFLLDDEEPRLMAALPVRLRPLAAVALHTGMRLGELLNLCWKDVDFAAATILVREAKAGEGRVAWMSPVASETLKALRQKQIRDGAAGGDITAMRERYLFQEARGAARTNLWRYWRAALLKAGINDLRFHDLRHTFGSRLVNQDVPLYTVKELLGHKTLKMTERYSHLEPGHLRDAVNRLAPQAGVQASGSFGGTSRVNFRHHHHSGSPEKTP
jgi:integrase